MAERGPETVTVELVPEFAEAATQLLTLLVLRADLASISPNLATQRAAREVLEMLAAAISSASWPPTSRGRRELCW